jgi:hypothetical protein
VIGLPASEDVNLPSSLVTVWRPSEVFVHTTFVPFGTLSVVGLKVYVPLVSTIFISYAFVDVDGEVAAVVGVDCEAAVVGVDGLVGVLAAPPQAARIRTAIVAAKQINQADRRRPKFCDKCIRKHLLDDAYLVRGCILSRIRYRLIR